MDMATVSGKRSPCASVWCRCSRDWKSLSMDTEPTPVATVAVVKIKMKRILKSQIGRDQPQSFDSVSGLLMGLRSWPCRLSEADLIRVIKADALIYIRRMSS